MRAALLFVVACIAFAAGVHVRDVEASGGSSKVNLSAYSGSVNITGTSGSTGLTVTATGTARAAAFAGSSRAPITLVSQSSAPTCGQGDIYYLLTGNTARLSVCVGGTWQDTAAIRTITTGITAFATGGQTNATAICTAGGLTTVNTVASANDSIKLPATPVIGQVCIIKNKGANTLALFPGSGDVLCVSGSACGAADASTTIATNVQIECTAETTGIWNCK
jgi:hypothetical protein